MTETQIRDFSRKGAVIILEEEDIGRFNISVYNAFVVHGLYAADSVEAVS